MWTNARPGAVAMGASELRTPGPPEPSCDRQEQGAQASKLQSGAASHCHPLAKGAWAKKIIAPAATTHGREPPSGRGHGHGRGHTHPGRQRGRGSIKYESRQATGWQQPHAADQPTHSSPTDALNDYPDTRQHAVLEEPGRSSVDASQITCQAAAPCPGTVHHDSEPPRGAKRLVMVPG